jgi:superfamily II DNA or RNA helicase
VNNSSSHPDLITPSSDNRLFDIFIRELLQSARVYIATAFYNSGAVNMLLKPFREFIEKGGEIYFLTSIMNHFNNPDILQHLSEKVPGCRIRIYDPKSDGTSLYDPLKPPAFHVKSYLFEHKDGRHSMIVGSSNLTRSGLLENCEWNYFSNLEINTAFENSTIFQKALYEFGNYWEKQSFPLNKEFINQYRPIYNKHRRLQKNLVREERKTYKTQRPRPEPLPAQIEALESLSRFRLNRIDKAAVIAAPGVGKTYLSAFDYKASTLPNVLYIAHRENILNQSIDTFRHVLNNPAFGTILTGNSSPAERKDAFAPGSSVFATVQTLSQSKVLNTFSPDHFAYIIVDEFHHSAADSYQKVIDHFTPRFFLGMTATPERMDGRDVLRFCDYNVAYETRLFDAVEKGWLAPFQYFAIYDPTDYTPIRWTGTGYDDQELERHLSTDTRARLIINNLKNFLPAFGKTKALAFCSNIGHARYMNEQFNRHDIPSRCLFGTSSIEERTEAMDQLADENHPLQVICSVDIFSEGIDIPQVTHVLLLRPTHSYTVFQQQLGRGLRRLPEKDYVIILDFIGNFRSSYVAPTILSGHYSVQTFKPEKQIPPRFETPRICHVDIETKVRRVWNDEIKRVLKPKNLKEHLLEQYRIVRENQDHSLNIMDVFANPEAEELDPKAAIRSFGNWLRFKREAGDLTEYEAALLDTPGERFLEHLERELHPSKSYKMAVLLYLLSTESDKTSWSVSEIAQGFLDFYLDNPVYLKDYDALARAAEPEKYPLSKVETHISNMPLNYLSNQENDCFDFDRESGVFAVREEYRGNWREERFRELVRDRVDFALKGYVRNK